MNADPAAAVPGQAPATRRATPAADRPRATAHRVGTRPAATAAATPAADQPADFAKLVQGQVAVGKDAGQPAGDGRRSAGKPASSARPSATAAANPNERTAAANTPIAPAVVLAAAPVPVPLPVPVPTPPAGPAAQQPAQGAPVPAADTPPADLAGRVLAMRQAGLPQMPAAAPPADRLAPPRTTPDEPTAAPADTPAAAAPTLQPAPAAAPPPSATPAHAATASASAFAPAATTPAVQIAHAMVALDGGAAGTHRVTVQLSPSELGRVQISIERSADGTSVVSVVAERPETLALVQADAARLHAALDQAGVAHGGRTLTFALGTAEADGPAGIAGATAPPDAAARTDGASNGSMQDNARDQSAPANWPADGSPAPDAGAANLGTGGQAQARQDGRPTARFMHTSQQTATIVGVPDAATGGATRATAPSRLAIDITA